MDEKEIEGYQSVKGQMESGYLDITDSHMDENEFRVIRKAIELYEERYVGGKNCKFCDLKGPILNSEAKIYYNDYDNVFRISTDEADTPINYCPMCGRKLV